MFLHDELQKLFPDVFLPPRARSSCGRVKRPT
jgi:hypothetical protein